MDDERRHNPGEPTFGEGHGGEHNPGEPSFGEEEFGDTELDRDDTHGTPDMAEDVNDAVEAAERPEGHS